tara:strand:- start:50 stop:442 length:393 start_codon:yes stop_codon:yes gene_type:complete
MKKSHSQLVTLELVDAIGHAFNSNNIDAVMQYFVDDATFDHASGPDIYGLRIEGADAIRAAFASLFDSVKSVHWTTLNTGIADNKAYCEYRRVAKLKNGEVQDFHSVDILTFRDGKIAHKDTYYKNRNSE